MLLEISRRSRKVMYLPLRFYSKAAKKIQSVDSSTDYSKFIFKTVPRNITIIPPKEILPNNFSYDKLLELIPKEPTNAVDFALKQFSNCVSEGAPLILSGLRSSHLFSKGRQFIDDNLSKMDALAISEGARLLALAKTCNEDEAEDSVRAEKMVNQLINLGIPFSMKQTIKFILLSLYDSQAFTNAINSYLDEGAPYRFLYHRETYTTFCCHLLRNKEVDLLIKLLPYSVCEDPANKESSIENLYNSPEVVYWLLKLLNDDDDNNKKLLTNWYFRALSNHDGPIPCYDFLNLIVPIMKALGVKLVNTKVLEDGRLSPQKHFKIDTREDSLDLQDFRNEIDGRMKQMVKRGAIVSPQEQLGLYKTVDALKNRAVAGKAIVVDTLNVSYSRTDFSFFIKKLIAEYPNMLLVTRAYQEQWLKSLRLPGNTMIFICNRVSEDDVVVIAASLLYGSNCYVLSNDRFVQHSHKFSSKGKSLFKKWVQHRVIRYDPTDGSHSVPNVANYKIQNLSANATSAEALFIPVLVDTPYLPYFTHWIAQQPK